MSSINCQSVFPLSAPDASADENDKSQTTAREDTMQSSHTGKTGKTLFFLYYSLGKPCPASSECGTSLHFIRSLHPEISTLNGIKSEQVGAPSMLLAVILELF
jgi:hypothetical protein